MNQKVEKGRNQYIDFLKGIAIIAVVLYHCGLLSNGYLGVDVFLVVSGYYLMKSYMVVSDSNINRKSARWYMNYLFRRLLRFWPLIIVISAITLAVGFFSMLPDDYENLSESIIASNVFANNILSAITTKNYWNISNEYKPLMHLWYIGLLIQAQVVFPIIFSLLDRISKKALVIGVGIMTIISIILYLDPTFSSSAKFYYIPFRAFEILSGSLLCFLPEINILDRTRGVLEIALVIIIMVIIIFRVPLCSTLCLLIIVFATTLYVLLCKNGNTKYFSALKPLEMAGMSSFSIYIVHQPIIALTRYMFTSSITGSTFYIVAALIVAMSIVAYKIEKLSIYWSKLKDIKKPMIACICSMLVVSIFAGAVYMKAGVMRDVPELDIYKETAYKGMHAEYVDSPYSLNKDFCDYDKKHILVIGNSMARDWCNILRESSNSKDYEISYVSEIDLLEKYQNRVSEADYIFYATLGDANDIKSKILKECLEGPKGYVVGVKNFGECNGQIYRKRNTEDYFSSTIFMGRTNGSTYDTYLDQNEAQKNKYKEKYIDMIDAVQNPDGSIPVFTDTNKYISADTIHLTKAGAQYYGRILDIKSIIK